MDLPRSPEQLLWETAGVAAIQAGSKDRRLAARLHR